MGTLREEMAVIYVVVWVYINIRIKEEKFIYRVYEN